jgi:hypothetical protein
MWPEVLVAGLAVFFALLLLWGFRNLPHEAWQFLAAVPLVKEDPETWKGMNLTYYGLLVAGSCVIGVAIGFFLMSSVHIPATLILILVTLLFLLCMPASWVVARLVEKKNHTFTIGGASFVGILIFPPIVWFVNYALSFFGDLRIPLFPVLASLSIAYCFGEGLGRLACISFGCCYGKPLSDCRPLARLIGGRLYFVFSGKTKKISYEGGLDGEPVVPIQAVTSVYYLAVGLASMLLYLRSYHCAAFALSLILTQVWRVISEIFRADYRGGGRLSAYQIMAFIGAMYAVALCLILPSDPTVSTDLRYGLSSLWDPGVILFLQALFAVVFLMTGQSTVTGSAISFHVVRDKI